MINAKKEKKLTNVQVLLDGSKRDDDEKLEPNPLVTTTPNPMSPSSKVLTQIVLINSYAHAELQCLYDHKVKECECLAQKLSKQTESVSKEVYTELLRSFAKLEKHSISLELALQQCQLKKLIEKNKGKVVDTNFEKQSILGKPPLQPIRNQPVVRQPTAYKYERSQLPRHKIASQVIVSHDLRKPVTPHSWPQVRKSSFAKPYDVNAPGPSRKSPKHVSFQSPKESVGSNDMVHNYYLEEAKKKAQL
ncbi:hypothetical protein Tco_1501930 [Tanacetum coccineum]